MIPVRVSPDVRPYVVRGGFVIAPDHPLAEFDCPVCDRPLTDAPVSLVYVGRENPTSWTAGSVAVHDACAVPPGGEPQRWALPPAPGPEVTAVRGNGGIVFERDGDGWVPRPSPFVRAKQHTVRRQWAALLACGPLTDATTDPKETP